MAQKILVIDDDLFIREIYEEVIKNAGYEADLAINGEEGVRKLQIGGYSLTLLDMNMPGINGLEVLDKVHDNPPGSANGPIILLSNSADDSVLKEALRKGATTYFIKSDLTPDQLSNNIKKILD